MELYNVYYVTGTVMCSRQFTDKDEAIRFARESNGIVKEEVFKAYFGKPGRMTAMEVCAREVR